MLWAFIAKTPLQSRKSLATLTGVMCSTSQCELRPTFPKLRVTNVIRIVTYYTLAPLESPDSSWMTRSQRSRRRYKGLLRHSISYDAHSDSGSLEALNSQPPPVRAAFPVQLHLGQWCFSNDASIFARLAEGLPCT